MATALTQLPPFGMAYWLPEFSLSFRSTNHDGEQAKRKRQGSAHTGGGRLTTAAVKLFKKQKP
jgi:hypothetical protein